MMQKIDCRTFIFWCEDINDSELTAEMRTALIEYRSSCAACADFAGVTEHQRRVVHSLPPHAVPVNLAVGLRVLASKEIARRTAKRDFSTRLGQWRAKARAWTREMWRPFGVPTAGGLASALILFSALMPTFVRQHGPNVDTPAAWFQSAEVEALSPFGVNLDQITLDVRIDSTGRVIDYSVPSDEAAWTKNVPLRRAVENNLLFMKFEPAKFFGQPAIDTIRVTIRRSQVEVNG